MRFREGLVSLLLILNLLLAVSSTGLSSQNTTNLHLSEVKDYTSSSTNTSIGFGQSHHVAYNGDLLGLSVNYELGAGLDLPALLQLDYPAYYTSGSEVPIHAEIIPADTAKAWSYTRGNASFLGYEFGNFESSLDTNPFTTPFGNSTVLLDFDNVYLADYYKAPGDALFGIYSTPEVSFDLYMDIDITVELESEGLLNMTLSDIENSANYSIVAGDSPISKDVTFQTSSSSTTGDTLELWTESHYQIYKLQANITSMTSTVQGYIDWTEDTGYGAGDAYDKTVSFIADTNISFPIIDLNQTEIGISPDSSHSDVQYYTTPSTELSATGEVDNDPPQISINSPTEGVETDNDTNHIIFWEASDNVELEYFDIYLDDQLLAGEVSPESREYVIDTLEEGDHTLRVEAFDILGHSQSDEVDFSVKIPVFQKVTRAVPFPMYSLLLAMIIFPVLRKRNN